MDNTEIIDFLKDAVQRCELQEEHIERQMEELQKARLQIVRAEGYYITLLSILGVDYDVFEKDLEKN